MNIKVYPQPGDKFIISESHVINITAVASEIVGFEEFKDGIRSFSTYRLKDFWKRVMHLKRKKRYHDTMPLQWSGDVYFGYSHGKAKSYMCATYRHGTRDFNYYSNSSWRP